VAELPKLANVAGIEDLAKEINRREEQRTAEQKNLNWNPEKVRIPERKRFLDWIEVELNKLMSIF